MEEEFSVQPLSEGLGFYTPVVTHAPKVGSKPQTNEAHPVWPLRPQAVLVGPTPKTNEAPPANEAHKVNKILGTNTTRPTGFVKGAGFVRGADFAPIDESNPQTSQNKEAYNELKALLEKPDLNTLKKHKTPSLSHSQNHPFTPKARFASVKTEEVKTGEVLLPTQGAFKKIFYSQAKAGLMDVLTASFFFFPPFMLFLVLTGGSVSVLSRLWPQVLIAFLLFMQMYCLLCRLFCFETCGEAVAKIRLASFKSKKGVVHPFLLFWRFLLSCSTGFLLLPLASLLFKKDLTGYLTGLYFQKLSNKTAL